MSNKKLTENNESNCSNGSNNGNIPIDNPAFVERVKQIFGTVFKYLGYVDLPDKGCYILVSPLCEDSDTIMIFGAACDEDIAELSEYSFGLETDEAVCLDVLKIFCKKYLLKEDGHIAPHEQIYKTL